MSTQRVSSDGKFRNNFDHLIINWGNTNLPSWAHANTRFLNHPHACRNSVNKINTFELLTKHHVPTVEWTTSRDAALEWAKNGSRVVVRKKVDGYGGEGIVMCTNSDDIPHAPLYTKHVSKSREYRVHVFKGKVFDLQQKRRRANAVDYQDGLIKNYANGWVFCRDEITEPPSDIQDIAIKSIAALGLDFGAVDILTKKGKCYVIEANSAVGLEGQTLVNYVTQFNGLDISR